MFPFTASSMRGLRRIELQDFGKPVAKRFIARSSLCEIRNGIDSRRMGYFVVPMLLMDWLS